MYQSIHYYYEGNNHFQQQATSNKQQKRLFLLFAILCSSLFLGAQNPYLNDANEQLRHIFSQITYPNNDVLFLYERSAKMSDSSFYSNNSVDTADFKVWRQVYDEMYYAAHDTLPLSKINTLEFNASQFYGDTIPIGLMDYEYFYLKEEAFSTGDYFLFDTINNYLFDHPSPIGSPYKKSNIFLASPFKEYSKWNVYGSH
ncbi:hypothetical protein CW751_07090 [Brumimicrobium salinarum]|uniref:Uncharacterized protein n=1 Tax=Brumimicrobium salinarum TaxID=2058658 RepID=A0A2I0R2Y1_9FLAO|nr:hypothetical protein [Brumimicrobium salinarum]PKR80926.1 hypothetical protein CW751_07090 [Brumimicrobium salinarum]